MSEDEAYPDSFDERSRRNAEKIMKTHEFRRQNVETVEPIEKDYFAYTADEPERYAALNVEHLFRFGTTYKAIKWGVFVGFLFGFHRYFRTRDVQNAAHWFTVMSLFSFFNIWISYGLQDFITDYGVRKNISVTSRNEINTSAYRAYLN